MIVRSLEDHRARVADALVAGPVLDLQLPDSLGAVLAEELMATTALPVTDSASQDGYAVVAADIARAGADVPVILPVAHDVRVELRQPRRHVPGTAARIPSGAPVPVGADAVVPLEYTDGGLAKVAVHRPVVAGRYIRPTGFDAQANQVLVASGTRIGARQLAAASALGRARLRVRPTPRVVVMAVGDELVEPGASRPGGAVPDSNSHMLAALVKDAGAQPYRMGVVPDSPLQLRSAIEDLMVRADVLITTGGLSDGPQDTLATVLAQLGQFEAVDLQLRPGGRHGFGIVTAGERAIPVVALPGGTAAAAIGYETYVRPALRALCGHQQTERRLISARSRKRWITTPGTVTAMPVLIDGDEGVGYSVLPLGADAVALSDLARADGLVLTGPDPVVVDVGDIVECVVWAA